MAFDSIEAAAAKLGDTSATWVDRRDAAAALSDFAQQALNALHKHNEDEDTDVRLAVQRALDDLTGINAPTVRAVSSGLTEGPNYADLVHQCAKPGEREVIENDGRLQVIVTMKNDRKQTVYVEPFTRKDGLKLIRVYTFCGEPSEDTFRWALEANMKLVQSAIGIVNKDGQEHFALIQCFLDGQITKPEMHTSIKEIAYYGDWLENRMTGRDEL